MRMTTVGDAVYAELLVEDELIRVRGYVMELAGKMATIAINPTACGRGD